MRSRRSPSPTGSPRSAWTESLGDYARLNLHLAAPGATAPADRPAPTVRVGAVKRSLPRGKTLVLPITCSGPCQVRARVPGRTNQGFLALKRAGHGRLEIRQNSDSLAPARLGPVRIQLLYSAPGAVAPASRTVTLRLSARPIRRLCGSSGCGRAVTAPTSP